MMQVIPTGGDSLNPLSSPSCATPLRPHPDFPLRPYPERSEGSPHPYRHCEACRQAGIRRIVCTLLKEIPHFVRDGREKRDGGGEKGFGMAASISKPINPIKKYLSFHYANPLGNIGQATMVGIP
ncbi:hypothetical protein [Thermoflavifilum thermophilum]|uniref:hypothetical protein n=1 Tax=Thermoflavifilum thermophilum TaxID=1393122 RepID=UPI0015A65B92|nr:hypothetical protein [Thermoflavifilum thermophilum]